MNWLERLENIELEVETGDGTVYKPLWIKAEKNIEFNTEGFDFVGVPGTYVERYEKKSDQYLVDFYFQGEDHIDVANNFEISAEDKRPWKIKHPFYDDIVVQPVSLRRDNNNYNISEFTGIVWATISQKFPEDQVLPGRTITTLKAETDLQTVDAFTIKVQTPSAALVQPSIRNIESISKIYEGVSNLNEDIKVLKDLTRQASGAAQGLLNDVNSFVNGTIALINFPLQIVGSLKQKINLVRDSFNKLFDLIDFDDDEQRASFEMLANTHLTTMSQAALNPDDSEEIKTRTEVLEVSETIQAVYAKMNEKIDEISLDGFIQDDVLSAKNDIIVNYTLSELFNTALNAKQERVFVLDKDDNMINLAHRFIGPGDDNIDLFIEQNDLSLDEYIQIKKGREITYYV